MGPVRRTERIVHVFFGELGELLRKRRVVLLFLFVKAQVLEQDDAAVAACGFDGFGRRCPNTVGRERHFASEQLLEPRRHRRQAELGSWSTLRPAKMAGEDRQRPLFERVLNGWQRRADAGVVLDDAIFQRDVEVGADEHTFPAQIEISDGEFRHEHRLERGRADGSMADPAPIQRTRDLS